MFTDVCVKCGNAQLGSSIEENGCYICGCDETVG